MNNNILMYLWVFVLTLVTVSYQNCGRVDLDSGAFQASEVLPIPVVDVVDPIEQNEGVAQDTSHIEGHAKLEKLDEQLEKSGGETTAFTLLDGPKYFYTKVSISPDQDDPRFRVNIINQYSEIGAQTYVRIITPLGQVRVCEMRQSSCTLQVCKPGTGDRPNCQDEHDEPYKIVSGEYAIKIWAGEQLKPDEDLHKLAVDFKP